MPMDPPPPPIPPYLKASSRTHSVSSTRSTSSTRSRSRPHRQNDYIPTTTATYAIVGTAEPVLETDLEARRLIDGDERSIDADERETRDDDSSVISEHHGTHRHDPQDDSDEEVDWDGIRDRDAAIRGKWRRPRPAWLYPFVFVLAMTVGMILAPKSELYVNLACLVHPPRLPSSIAHIASAPIGEASIHRRSLHPHVHTYVWAHGGLTTTAIEATVNSTVPLDPSVSPVKPLTPADRWFLKLQRDIYEYRKSHHGASPSHPHSHSHTSISTSTKAGHSATPTLPPGHMPHPTLPVDQRPFPGDDHGNEDDNDDDESGPDEGNDSGEPEGRRRKHDHRFKAIDPAMCKRDPSVQAATAKLIMAMTVTLGVLSAMTTGYWGKLSDRIGRSKILAFLEVGTLLSEISFILVASFPYLAPGGYRSLLISPIFDGLFGGFACFSATSHAYISDLAPHDTRAAAFAKLAGTIMTGFAVGPLVGTALIRATDDIMTPFYVNLVIHVIGLSFVLFVLPESLSKEARVHLAKKAHKAAAAKARKEALQREWEDEEADDTADPSHGQSGWSLMSLGGGTKPPSRWRKRFAGRVQRGFYRMFAFLEPLSVFKPADGKNGRKDWRLALVAFAIFCEAMNFGVMAIKAQYMFYAYGWTSKELGLFMSASGFCRGFCLIVVLPLIMSRLRRWYAIDPAAPPSGTAPEATSPSDETVGAPCATAATTPAMSKPQVHLDLLTARGSFVVTSTCLFLFSLNLPVVQFVTTSFLSNLGTGSTPALNSLALALLPSKSESGRLFGALAVIHALGTTLISPILYGELFASTVGWYAPTIFFVAGFMPLLALTASLFVRVHKSPAEGDEERAPGDPGVQLSTGE